MLSVNHSVTGTRKPTLLRSVISFGRSERATSRRTRFVRSSSTRQWSGSVATNSTSWWSRKGTRAAIEQVVGQPARLVEVEHLAQRARVRMHVEGRQVVAHLALVHAQARELPAAAEVHGAEPAHVALAPVLAVQALHRDLHVAEAER